MTAVELLERGAAQVDTLQQSAPDAHAHLLRIFGDIHEELELYDQISAAAREKRSVSARLPRKGRLRNGDG